MRKPILLVGLTVLIAAGASLAAANLLMRGVAPASQNAAAAPPSLSDGVVLGDPTPRFVANTKKEAAEAIDATAWAPMNQALVQLARRYLGLPFKGFSLDGGPKEQLLLDLTQFDCFLFVEQLLALSNSRKVDTKTEGWSASASTCGGCAMWMARWTTAAGSITSAAGPKRPSAMATW